MPFYKLIPIWFVAILCLTPFGFAAMPIFVIISIIGGITAIAHYKRKEVTPT